VLNSLAPAELRAPGRALIYAAVLGSLGRGREAVPYIDCVKPTILLPEEAEILRDAMHKSTPAG
jgi:hypothetical protein